MNKQELRTNKQELISKYELLKNSYNFKAIATDAIISDLKRLDEPEMGHADEAPRYVKNILARLRELPLHDREVWLKAIMGEFEKDFSRAKWREGYEQGKFEGEYIPEKVTIPQYIADKIEYFKESGDWDLFQAMDDLFEHTKTCEWLEVKDNQEIFAQAWMFGYEVEKEKRYYIRLKNVDENYNYLNYIKHLNAWVLAEIKTDKNFVQNTPKKNLKMQTSEKYSTVLCLKSRRLSDGIFTYKHKLGS